MHQCYPLLHVVKQKCIRKTDCLLLGNLLYIMSNRTPIYVSLSREYSERGEIQFWIMKDLKALKPDILAELSACQVLLGASMLLVERQA